MIFERADSAAVIRRALALLGREGAMDGGALTGLHHDRVVSVLRALRPDLSLRQAEALLRDGAHAIVSSRS